MTNTNLSPPLFLHPEIVTLLQDHETFDTHVRRLLAASLPSPLHQRVDSVPYVPEDVRKLVTVDTRFHQYWHDLTGTASPSFLAAGPRSTLAFDPLTVRGAIVVAGGTAPGINVVVHKLVKRHVCDYGTPEANMLGFVGGFRGLSRQGNTNFLPLTLSLTEDCLTDPGCLIGMSRERKDIAVMVDTLRDLAIDILYVVGGDGTLEAAHCLAAECDRTNLLTAVIGIPKTIDNDVLWCWQTFGFCTAVQKAMECIQSFHANVRTHSRIGIMIVYGGESGFLAANAGYASGPGVADAIIIPEEPPTLEHVVHYAQKLVARQHRPLDDHALFVMAEGVAWSEPFRAAMVAQLQRQGSIPGGAPIPPPDTWPSEGVREALRCLLTDNFRTVSGNHHSLVITEPRSLVSSVPPSAADVIYCQRLADHAVDAALAGYTDCMSSFWESEYVLVPLSLVAGQHKQLPTEGTFWTSCRSLTGQPRWQ